MPIGLKVHWGRMREFLKQLEFGLWKLPGQFIMFTFHIGTKCNFADIPKEDSEFCI